MQNFRRKVFIEILFIFSLFEFSFAYIGEEMQTNKGPLLQNVESKPFVPEDNDLHQSDILSPDQILKDSEIQLKSDLLSPDQILKGSETLDPVEMQEGDHSFLYAFDLDHFVDVTNDLKMKHELESSVMKTFLNESQYQMSHEQNARVRSILITHFENKL